MQCMPMEQDCLHDQHDCWHIILYSNVVACILVVYSISPFASCVLLLRLNRTCKGSLATCPGLLVCSPPPVGRPAVRARARTDAFARLCM